MECFGVFGEILCAVGRVEALWENDQSCTSLGSFKDLASGMGEVDGFVRTCSTSLCQWAGARHEGDESIT